ncbi:MAG: TIGR03668 family PPOX class F420-dependent oxidoreductase [Thermomicrobiales bacterium]
MSAPVLDATIQRYLAAHRVARLTTVDATGRPAIVPICYATDGQMIYSALDAKPKRVHPTALRRVRNILANPGVALVVDEYAEAWAQLSHLIIHGSASLVAPGTAEHESAITLLRAKYPQYATMPIEEQPVIAIRPVRARFWSASPDAEETGAEPPRYLDFDALVRGRRSVRAFRPDPVPRGLIERVLDAARWAPSPHGRQPWRFAVITQPAVKARLADAMGETWQATLAMDNEPAAVVAERLARSHARIREAPVLILLCLFTADLDHYPDPDRQAAETTMAIQSLGAAAQTLLLTAYRLGLDGGWMCAPLFCPETVRDALDLPPALVPHALLPLGYAAKDPKRRPRLPLADLIVLWE